MSYYQKYRPQDLSELVGQEPVKQTILQAFRKSRLSHAYLLAGPRGTGKTSTARILAKMVNCQKSEVGSRKSDDKIPCNQCDICQSITDGSNLDLIEIDAASNRGIEDIRALRERIKLAPSNAKKKVYIIDEVHMLTQEAFNALLKTLEEPPSHALFILATTDATKLPQTILSRVQTLDFQLAKTSELMDVLKRIVTIEKIDIDENALKLLIKKSDGSFRDGVKLLDQVSTLGKITAEVLEKSLKSSSFDDNLTLVESLAKKDSNAGLTWVIKQTERGIDTKDLILALQEILRNLVFIKNGLGEQLVEPNLGEENYQSLVEICKNFTNEDLVKNLDILQKALEKLKTASIPQLALELAVVEICSMQEVPRVEQVSQVPQVEEEKLDVGNEKLDMDNDARSEKSHIQPQVPTSHLSPLTSDSPDIQKLKEKWTFVLETIRPYNFSLEAMLRSVRISECTDSTVIMEVPYSFHQRILEAPKNRDILEAIFSDILGRKVQISTVLGNRPARVEDVANIEVAQDDEIIRVASEIFNSDSVN